jgi:uncharacterized RDD family membrane protein YckC
VAIEMPERYKNMHNFPGENRGVKNPPRYTPPPVDQSKGNWTTPESNWQSQQQPPYLPPPPQYGYPYQPIQSIEPADFGTRLIGLVLDGLIVGIPSSIIIGLLNIFSWWPFGGWGFITNYPFSWGSSIIFWGIYAWYCYTYLNGNTIGKKLMDVRLANPDGSKPNIQTFMLHFTVGYLVNGLFLSLGFIWALFDSYRQTWGQKIFHTYTVKGNW